MKSLDVNLKLFLSFPLFGDGFYRVCFLQRRSSIPTTTTVDTGPVVTSLFEGQRTRNPSERSSVNRTLDIVDKLSRNDIDQTRDKRKTVKYLPISRPPFVLKLVPATVPFQNR